MEVRCSSQDFCLTVGTENETVGSRVEVGLIGSLLMADRQRESERRAFSHVTLHPHPSAMQINELAGQGQSKAGALHLLVRRPHLAELLEDRLLILGGDSYAGVRDGDLGQRLV